MSDKHRHIALGIPDIVFGAFASNLVGHSRLGTGMNLWTASSSSEIRRERATNKERVNDSKLRVVIVEDSPIIRARLAESLSEIPNLEITGQAESESDALALLGGGDWDAVVLDLQLKQGTGLGVLKKLRQEGRASHTKVIVFTNYAFPQYRDRSLSFGADFFFDKAREFHRVRDVLADLASGEPPRVPS